MIHVTMYDVRAVVPWALPPPKSQAERIRRQRDTNLAHAVLVFLRGCDGGDTAGVTDPLAEPTCPTCRLLWATRAIRQDAALEAA